MKYENLKMLYDSFVDEISKITFRNRLLYSLTGDIRYIIEIFDLDISYDPERMKLGDYLRDAIKNNYKDTLIVYGAKTVGPTFFEFNKALGLQDILCFCDGDKELQKIEVCGKKVISPNELVTNYSDKYVLIQSYHYRDEIYNNLIAMGFPKQNIIQNSYDKIPYFSFEKFSYQADEVFVDGGVFDLDSSIQFSEHCNNRYSKIFAFEPDEDNYRKCIEISKDKNINNVFFFNKGLWYQQETLWFRTHEISSSSHVVLEDSISDKDSKVEVVALDEILRDEKVTFIKMDIEGSELQALKGACEIIKKNKPKLAICIYHKAEDIIDIPSYIKELVPEYKLAIRHYSDWMWETVLYAYID